MVAVGTDQVAVPVVVVKDLEGMAMAVKEMVAGVMDLAAAVIAQVVAT